MKIQVTALILFFLLATKAFSQNGDRDQSIQNDFQNYVNTESSRNYTGSFLPVFSNKENIVGSRYLFGRWVKGKVMNRSNALISDDSYVFNYDKISMKLLATQDNKTVVEVNDEGIESFSLTYDGITTVFLRVPLINAKDFFVSLVESEKGYSLYKKIVTRFQKANFTTNGLIQSGKNYDEYVDEPEYYVISPGSKDVKRLLFTRKSVKEVFKPKISAVRSYFSEHSGENFDESYLAGLINFLNH